MLYLSNNYFPIPTNKIKFIYIKHTSQYRGSRAFKISITVENKLFKECFGIGDFSTEKEEELYKTFLKELKKRKINYEIKQS